MDFNYEVSTNELSPSTFQFMSEVSANSLVRTFTAFSAWLTTAPWWHHSKTIM